MNLSLTEAERAHLAALGVAAGADGTLRATSGAAVDAGTAVALLSKASVSPSDFTRGPLLDGHAAASAGQWTIGAPGDGHVARTGPAGPPGPIGSGTADRGMSTDGDDGLVPGSDEDGEGVGPPDLAKMTPAAFRRHYLAAGHQSDSPANTGRRGMTAVPETASEAEPQGFTRGPLQAGHEADPPGNDPAGNNPHPGGTPAREVYGTAAGRYEANRGLDRTDHMLPSTSMRAGSEPQPARVAMPGDMRASSVPAAVQVAATKPAPGEMR